MIKSLFAVLLIALVSGIPLDLFPVSQDSHELSAIELVEKIHQNILSIPEMDKWQASVLNTLIEMDKNWEPKKKTIIEKLITVENQKRIEQILSATEYDKNKTKDVTAKYKVEAAKSNLRNKSDNEKNGQRRGGRRRGMDLSRDELFPFSENRINDYDFDLGEDVLEDNQRVYVLQTRSKQKASDFFEGQYYIHPETFDVLHAELRPAKNPGPLKLLEMHIDFDRLPEGYLVIRAAKVRVHVGLIIKNIRIESEELYSEYKVFE
jgi:hypothetical protein